MKIRDRIRELRRVPAATLAPNPKNWRTHPAAQADALRGVLAEVVRQAAERPEPARRAAEPDRRQGGRHVLDRQRGREPVDDGPVRRPVVGVALRALGLLAPKAREQLIPELRKHLTDEYPTPRRNAALGLITLTPDDPAVYKPWLPEVGGNTIREYWGELDAEVRKLGPKAIPPLRKLLADRDPKVRLKAAFAILLRDPADEPAAKVFTASVMTADECRLFAKLRPPAADQVAGFVGDPKSAVGFR